MVLDIVSQHELYAVLHDLTVQVPPALSFTEDRLKTLLDTKFGAHECLMAFAADTTIPVSVRQHSIIAFKNALVNQASSAWKSRKYMDDLQRQKVRGLIFHLLQEEDPVIWKANKVIFGKIARNDYPKNWPDLFDHLLEILDNSIQSIPHKPSFLVLQRGLDALNQILKELTAMKMPQQLEIIKGVAEKLIQPLMNYYKALNSVYILAPRSAIALPESEDGILCAHYAFKCLTKIALWVWNRPTGKTGYEELSLWFSYQFFPAAATCLPLVHENRLNVISDLQQLGQAMPKSLHSMTIHLRSYGKFFRRTQQLAPERFIRLPGSGNLVIYYWEIVVQAVARPLEHIADSTLAPIPIPILIQAMAIFKDTIPQWSRDISDTVLTPDLVRGAVELIILRFIRLKDTDLEEWDSNPEGWLNAEDKEEEQWEFDIRRCSERLLMTIAKQQSETVGPLLKDALMQVNANPVNTFADIVGKEAVYCAIGRCVYQLYDMIPFAEWLEQNLRLEAFEVNGSHWIIKRRIAWLITKWVVADSTGQLAQNARIWEVLVHLLRDQGPGAHPVVRLTAMMAIKCCSNVYNFKPDVVAPYIGTIITEFIRLIANADETETRTHIMDSIGVFTEAVGLHIIPYLNVIQAVVPELWRIADHNRQDDNKPEDWLLKKSILVTLTKTVEASEEHSETLMETYISRIIACFESAESKLNLDEAGLVLWQAALRNARTLGSHAHPFSLFTIFNHLIELLATNADLLGSILSITESYLLLDAHKLVEVYGYKLCGAFSTIITQPLIMNIKSVVAAIGLMVRLADARSWAQSMHTSGLFSIMMDTIIKDEATVPILTEHIYVMARIAVVDPPTFLNLMNATAMARGIAPALLWEGLLDQWWRRFDNFTEPQNRKLVIMGITSLVATGQHEVLDRLSSEIATMWTDVFSEMREAFEEAADDSQRSSPIHFSSRLVQYWQGSLDPPEEFMKSTEGTQEGNRRKDVFATDPVTTEKLTSFVAVRYALAVQISGGQQIFEARYLRDMDPAIMAHLLREFNSSN